MQTKPTKKPLILLLLLLVLLGGLTYTMAQGGYLQGIVRPGSLNLGGSGSIVQDTTDTDTTLLDPGDEAESVADEVAGYAEDAAAAEADAATAAQSGDADALEAAVTEAETAADNAQTAYDEMATSVTRAETYSENADQALTDGITEQADAQKVIEDAEAAYEAIAETNSGTAFDAFGIPTSEEHLTWPETFELQDDYEACTDEYNAAQEIINCSTKQSKYAAAKLDLCANYYNTSTLICSMTYANDFDDIYQSAKDYYDLWQDSQAEYDSNFPSDYLTDLQTAATDKADDLERAQAADTAAAADLADAQTSAENAATFEILTCTSLTLDPSSYEMLSTDTEAAFDFTVTIETGEQGSDIDMSGTTIVPVSNILNDLLAIASIKTGSINLSTPSIGSGTHSGSGSSSSGTTTYEYWSGTLVVEVNSADGELTYDGDTNTRFEIDLTEADTLDFSFSGGQDGDSIDISIDGQTLRCSETIKITQAAEVVVTPTDTDGDGLTDDEEATLKTDPALTDTDGDGVSDGDEVTAGTDPLVVEVIVEAYDGTLDSDADGLTADEEATNGTDADDSDSDNDGLLDGEEVNTHSTDPMDSDSDDDGLSDYAEIETYDTDPNDSDTDGDTYSDGAEITDATDPLDATDYTGAIDTTTTTTTTTTSDEVPSLTRDIILADYTCTDSFLDTVGEWHQDIVCRAKEAGWVKGYATTVFGPDGDITRAEYVKVLTKIFGLDEDDGYDGSNGFYDVQSEEWFYPYINLAAQKDWIRTRDNGYNFNPNEPINRADAILWAIRAAGEGTFSYDVEAVFSDVENDDYFAYALAIANSTLVDTADDTDQPIVEGYTDGTFGPYKNIARSEAMAIATRIAIAWGVASEDWDD